MIDQVRSIIIEYLAGRVSARDLAVGLPDAWQLEEDGDEATRDLVLRAVGYLAEHERGDRDSASLRHALTNLLSTTSLALGGKIEVQRTPEPVVSTQLAGTPLQAVFA